MSPRQGPEYFCFGPFLVFTAERLARHSRNQKNLATDETDEHRSILLKESATHQDEGEQKIEGRREREKTFARNRRFLYIAMQRSEAIAKKLTTKDTKVSRRARRKAFERRARSRE